MYMYMYMYICICICISTHIVVCARAARVQIRRPYQGPMFWIGDFSRD